VKTNRSSGSAHGSSVVIIRAITAVARVRISLYLRYNPVNLTDR